MNLNFNRSWEFNMVRPDTQPAGQHSRRQVLMPNCVLQADGENPLDVLEPVEEDVDEERVGDEEEEEGEDLMENMEQ